MGFKLGDDGTILGEDGKPLVDSSGKKIRLEGLLSQEKFDATLTAKLKSEREKAEAKHKELVESYEKRLASASSPQEAEELRKRIAELEEEHLSKEQQAAQKIQRARQESEAELDKFRKKAEQREANFNNLRVETDLVQAAAKAGFVDPADAVLVLSGRVALAHLSLFTSRKQLFSPLSAS